MKKQTLVTIRKRLAKIAADAIAWTAVISMMMMLVETLLFVDGVAKYTDIMVWGVISFVCFVVNQYGWED